MRCSSALSRVLSAALVVLLFVLPVSGLAVTSEELEDSLKRAEDLRRAAAEEDARASEIDREIGSLDGAIAEIESELYGLKSEISEVEDRRSRLEGEIAILENGIASKEREISGTQAELDERVRLLSARVAETYKNGDTFLIELLLDSKSLRDFMQRTTFAQAIMRADERVAEELRTARRSLEDTKAQLDRDLETIQTKRNEVLAEEKSLEVLEDRQESRLADQERALDQKEDLLSETEANAERLRELAEAEEAESQRIAAELAADASSGSGVYDGDFAWPVPGFYRITSAFGPRICPYHGQENHSGLDVGRNLDPWQEINGATIIAAGNGTVIKAESYSGYGNTVMIDHGDGLVSLYAHQQSGSIQVAVGQYVVKGQAIGRVGSTGYSTAPHLHFEVRVNGSPVSPMNYLQ